MDSIFLGSVLGPNRMQAIFEMDNEFDQAELYPDINIGVYEPLLEVPPT
jgi:hypothetical protein